MTYLARVPIGPQIQTPRGDDTRPQPGAEGKKNHVIRTHTGTESMFRDPPCIGIVLHPTGGVKGLFELPANGHVYPGGKVGGRKDNPLHPIERAAAAYPDRGNRILGKTMLGEQTARRFDDETESSLRALLRQRRELDSSQAVRWMGREHHRSLGSADIHADKNHFRARSWS